MASIEMTDYDYNKAVKIMANIEEYPEDYKYDVIVLLAKLTARYEIEKYEKPLKKGA